ncbi:hypothetical protein Q3G72_007218 [Acer saccharum]|nr:hypothetical protein Q3G72_007218 [Acer saccharum]
MASKCISELDTSRASFSCILGPRIADLISTDSQSLTAMTAEAITNIFSKGDYCRYFPSLETTGAVDKLAGLLQNCDDPIIQINIFTVLSKLAEFGILETVDKVLQRIRFDQLAELLSHNAQEWHEFMFAILMSLIKARKSKAVERMFAFKMEKNLIKLLKNESEVVQHHAIVTLKAFYEIAGPPANSSLRPANLRLCRGKAAGFSLHSITPDAFQQRWFACFESDLSDGSHRKDCSIT